MREQPKLFSPGIVQHELLMAGLYLVAYELVKSSIVEQPKRFFLGFESTSETSARNRAKYRSDVLARHDDPLIASAMWHVEMGALVAEDVNLLRDLRRHRNELAHELPTFMIDAARSVAVEQIPKLVSLVKKVDTWWILNVHVPTSPDYDGVPVEAEDVSSGPLLLLQHLVDMLSRQSATDTSN